MFDEFTFVLIEMCYYGKHSWFKWNNHCKQMNPLGDNSIFLQYRIVDMLLSIVPARVCWLVGYYFVIDSEKIFRNFLKYCFIHAHSFF